MNPTITSTFTFENGMILPPSTPKTLAPLPYGLDWAVLPRLQQPGHINRLFRGMYGDQFQRPRHSPTLFYMGNRAETEALVRHFGIKELRTPGDTVKAFPYEPLPTDENGDGSYGGWHFGPQGLPELWTRNQTQDCVFFPAAIEGAMPIAYMSLLRSVSLEMPVHMGVAVEGYPDLRTQVFRYPGADRQTFFDRMFRFAAVFGFESYVQRRITPAGFAFQLVNVPAAEAVPISPVFSAESGFHETGHVPYMILGMQISRYPQVRRVKAETFTYTLRQPS